MTTDPAHFAPWTPLLACRSFELDHLSVPSGRLAIRDVYDLDSPQVVLTVPIGDHRVWATEFDIRSNLKGGDPLFRPAHLSVQVSDAAPTRVGLPDTLYHKEIPSYGVSVDTDLGIILIHDADSLSAADMESLDESWEQAWESTDDYSEVHSGGGARVITCKTVFEKKRFPILASFDADDYPVAVHIDFGVIDTDGTATWTAQVARARSWGTKAGRMFPWLFRQR
ncbi:hypothetical protein HNP40_000763 [Mycobacteroides chelonae]|nr:hypothetical protein [Mycobacteroides chelonae]